MGLATGDSELTTPEKGIQSLASATSDSGRAHVTSAVCLKTSGTVEFLVVQR